MAQLVKILSIDGGGIRGIIPAMVLAEIERRTEKPISALFDLIAGTSTGGLLALGLTKPDANGHAEWTAEKLIELYETDGGKIFHRSRWHKVLALGNLAEEKYPAKGIEEVVPAVPLEDRTDSGVDTAIAPLDAAPIEEATILLVLVADLLEVVQATET